MATSVKLKAGDSFPSLQATLLDGSSVTLGQPKGDATWQAVFVYRGKHCPLCTKYLNELEGYKQAFAEAGVDILAVSGDSKSSLRASRETRNQLPDCLRPNRRTNENIRSVHFTASFRARD